MSAGAGLMRQPHAQLYLRRQSPSRTVNYFSTTSSGVMDRQNGMVEGDEEEEVVEEEKDERGEMEEVERAAEKEVGVQEQEGQEEEKE